MAMNNSNTAAEEGSNWGSAILRQNVTQKIVEAIQQCAMPTSKSAVEMENHVFAKAKTKEEYLGYVARLIIHIRELNSNKGEGQNKNFSGKSGAGNNFQPSQQQQPQQQQQLQDPINALKTLAHQGSGSPMMPPGGSGMMPVGGSGMMPQGGGVMMPQGGNGMMPQGANGMMPQGANGMMPQGANGMMPQGSNGMMPQGSNGMMSQGGSGMMPQGGSGMMSQGGSGMMPQGGSSMIPPGANGMIPQGGNGMIPQGGNGMMPQGGSGMMPQGGSGNQQGGTANIANVQNQRPGPQKNMQPNMMGQPNALIGEIGTMNQGGPMGPNGPMMQGGPLVQGASLVQGCPMGPAGPIGQGAQGSSLGQGLVGPGVPMNQGPGAGQGRPMMPGRPMGQGGMLPGGPMGQVAPPQQDQIVQNQMNMGPGTVGLPSVNTSVPVPPPGQMGPNPMGMNGGPMGPVLPGHMGAPSISMTQQRKVPEAMQGQVFQGPKGPVPNQQYGIRQNLPPSPGNVVIPSPSQMSNSGSKHPAVPSPASNVPLNTPQMSQSTIPSPVSGDEHKYREKIRQLSKYIEPLRRMIANIGNEDLEKTSKMKKLLEILTNPNQRMPLDTILKCEVVLEKLDFKRFDTGELSRSGGSEVVNRDQHSFVDALLTTMQTTHAAHTVHRTLQSVQFPLSGLLYKLPSAREMCKFRQEDFPMYAEEVPVIIQGEIARLNARFKVSLDQSKPKNSKYIHMQCWLDDKALPCVPPIQLVVKVDYPKVNPVYHLSESEYGATEFLRGVKAAMTNRVSFLPRMFTITHLMRNWEMSVRDACDPEQELTNELNVFIGL